MDSIIESGFDLPFGPLENKIWFYVRIKAKYGLSITEVISRSLSKVTRNIKIRISSQTGIKIDAKMSGIKAGMETNVSNGIKSAAILLPGDSFTLRFSDSKNEQTESVYFWTDV